MGIFQEPPHSMLHEEIAYHHQEVGIAQTRLPLKHLILHHYNLPMSQSPLSSL